MVDAGDCLLSADPSLVEEIASSSPADGGGLLATTLKVFLAVGKWSVNRAATTVRRFNPPLSPFRKGGFFDNYLLQDADYEKIVL